jgi:protein involved in polysaccharide export with SLBB domain
MRISDLVFRAGGVTKFAYLEKAELTRRRLSQGGDVALRVEINLHRALAEDLEHNLLLEDFDHLLVRSIPDVEQVQTVEIIGEVHFPGVYPILKGERLSAVLQRAGGFTPEAYLRGAVLTRPSAKATQEKRLQELVRVEEEALLTASALGTQTALTTQEAEIRQQAFDFRRDLLARLRTVQLDGRVVVHLKPLEQFAGSVADVEVEPGDRLEIPQVPKYVNVLGEVFNRAALVYNPKHTVADYLQQVGGLRADALEKEIYLVQLDGTVISNSQSQFAVVSDQGQTVRFRDFFAVKPQPGDSIVVPRRTQEPATLRNIRDIVQIVFQGIGTAGILAALFQAARVSVCIPRP